ncbi:MAG: PBP1A family penicillin-binding protein [Alphaproteobacteria bacterium]
MFFRDLPDCTRLNHYYPQQTVQLFGADNQVFASFAKQRRYVVPLEQIPPLLQQAFLVAEDKDFFYHCGLDIKGILRAFAVNTLQRKWQGRPMGGSTLTQQLVKNFFVGNEQKLQRKIREAFLALRLDHALGKNRILEIYLNEIYLGRRAYGVVAAANAYFNKSLDELTLAEMAFIAALAKAPSNDNSQSQQHERQNSRCNWVLQRMAQEGVIGQEEANEAQREALHFHHDKAKEKSEYFAEEVRQQLVARWGSEKFYRLGLKVQTTLQPKMQEIVDETLRAALIQLDRNFGWRGPLGHIPLDQQQSPKEIARILATYQKQSGPIFTVAVIREVSERGISIQTHSLHDGVIHRKSMAWALDKHPPQKLFKAWDIILVSRAGPKTYNLEQLPYITGAVVALEPTTGKILALSGGFSFQKTPFNCATKALRQMGSTFKPFVYLAALEQGFTPDSLIDDSPLAIPLAEGTIYRPRNITHKFYGPTSLATGLIHSRNVVTVKLAQAVGMVHISSLAQRLGLTKTPHYNLASALGAREATLLRLTLAYAMIANGGYYVDPVFIESIYDSNDSLLWQQEPFHKQMVIAPDNVRTLTMLLRSVVEEGTARRLNHLPYWIAGKTGTTSNNTNCSFVGFTNNIVIGVLVGFPIPRSLGEKATGASIALPIFEKIIQGLNNLD